MTPVEDFGTTTFCALLPPLRRTQRVRRERGGGRRAITYPASTHRAINKLDMRG
jgi:hypothetical protein